MSTDDEARRTFAVPPASGRFDGVDLAFLDPGDEDERAFLIRAEHPELAAAIRRGDEEIEIEGQVMNARLHLVVHEIVASQLWADAPPEVWETARRLLDAGYERHEILHMIGSAVAGNISAILKPGGVDEFSYVAALHLLPASWEQQRAFVNNEDP